MKYYVSARGYTIYERTNRLPLLVEDFPPPALNRSALAIPWKVPYICTSAPQQTLSIFNPLIKFSDLLDCFTLSCFIQLCNEVENAVYFRFGSCDDITKLKNVIIIIDTIISWCASGGAKYCRSHELWRESDGDLYLAFCCR